MSINNSFFEIGYGYALYLIFAALQSGAFLAIYTKLVKNNDETEQNTSLSLCYFAGFSLTIFLLIILSIFKIGFSYSVITIAIIYLLIIITQKSYRFIRRNISWQDILLLAVLISFFSVQNLCNWTFDGAYDLNSSPHASFGSMESGRYSNISNFIAKYDFIPVLGQNYLQSIYAAFNQSGSSLFNLFALLSINQALLFICLLSIAKRFFNLNKYSAWLLTIFYFFGSWSFSKSHIFLIDSGSPFFITGYSDTIISVGSFLFFYIIAISRLELLRKSILIFIVSFGWPLFAPQNIIFGLAVLSLMSVVKFIKGYSKNIIKFEWQLVAASLSAILLASMFGGMLSPSFLRTASNIPGIIEVSGGVFPVFKPALDYLFFHSHEMGFGFSHHTIHLQVGSIKAAPNEYFDIIKILFMPLLGVGLYFIFRRQKVLKRRELAEELEKYEFGIYAFIIILLFCLLISFGENKWVMSRFMLPGFIISLAALAKIMECHFQQIKNLLIRIVLLLMISISFVPILNTVYFRWHYYFNSNLVNSTSKLLILNSDIGK